MREFVNEHQVAGADQRRNDPHIGEIARTEDARGLRALEAGEATFQLAKQRVVASDETRGAGADAITLKRLDCCSLDGRAMGEVEVVVAGERQQAAAIAPHPAAILPRALDQIAMEIRAVKLAKFLDRKVVER